MSRVAISGRGAVSAAGLGVEPLWRAAREGRDLTTALEFGRGPALNVQVAASVPNFDPTAHLSDQQVRRCDRYTQFAHVAAFEALDEAGLTANSVAGPRTAIIVGTGIGGMTTLDEGCYNFYSGEARVNPLSIPRLMPSSAAAHLSITYGVTGPSFCVTSACASASQSIGVGLQMIRAGIVDRAIVGGAEACLTPATVRAWELLRVLSPNACRPFARGRNGLILGEGAGIVILESEAALERRGREPLAWLSGYGTTSDAKDILQPDALGAAGAMLAALADAGLSEADIDYVNAHGTGTVLNDITEADAMGRVFQALEALPVSSTKAVIGHALGAAGALELIVTSCAVREAVVPPQGNLAELDPRCARLNLPGEALSKGLRHAMSNSFAFGGINASLIISRA